MCVNILIAVLSNVFHVVSPTCADDLLLHFPYNDHYNDVTCHKAIATLYGDGVSLVADANRPGKVACFTGQTHFEVTVTSRNNQIDRVL